MKKQFALFVIVPVIIGCTENKREMGIPFKTEPIGTGAGDSSYSENADAKLNKYLMLDSKRCLHASNRCIVLIDFSETGQNNYMINFIDTATITGEMFEYYCSWCVDMSKYEHIINLVRNNARSDVDLGQCNVND